MQLPIKILFLVVAYIIQSTFVVAQSTAPVKIPYTQKNISLDGYLNESLWNEAFRSTDFKQVEPELGGDPSEYTEVYLIYGTTYLYIGARIHFEDVEEMYSTVMERDESLDRDDYFEVHLDTYNDRANALIFRTNILGARYDYESSRNGEEFNDSWNTFWDVATARQEFGWSVEMRIPFSSLRYENIAEQVMRFKAVVKYKNANETIIYPLNDMERTPIINQYNNSQEIIFNSLPSGKPVYITPYVKGGIYSSNEINDAGTAYNKETNIFEGKDYVDNTVLDKSLSNIGLDLKWKPSSSSTVDLTLNTDFAEVEADDRIINISRFPISLPEKRLFFLENADFFNSNMFEHRLFYSRRIGISEGKAVPIIGGVRYIGNKNEWEYGFMSLQTHEVDDINLPFHNMSVTRIKREIGNRGSYLGFINTNKLGADYNILTAFDASIRSRENIRTRAALAATFDKQTGSFEPFYGIAVNTFKANGFGLEYRYRNYTKNFNPELGFVGEPNTKRITLNNGWRRTFSDHPSLQSISIGHYVRNYWLSSNNKQFTFQTNLYSSFSFKKGFSIGAIGPLYLIENLYNGWKISENITIPTGEYKMWSIRPNFNTGDASNYRVSGSIEYGQFYGGTKTTVRGDLLYDLSRYFQTEFGMVINQLNLPAEFSSNGSNVLHLNLYYTKFKFAFSRKAFLNTFAQYSTNNDDLGWNIRFRYTPMEGTNLYIVYNHNINTDRNMTTPRLPVTEFQGFTFKFSKTLIR